MWILINARSLGTHLSRRSRVTCTVLCAGNVYMGYEWMLVLNLLTVMCPCLILNCFTFYCNGELGHPSSVAQRYVVMNSKLCTYVTLIYFLDNSTVLLFWYRLYSLYVVWEFYCNCFFLSRSIGGSVCCSCLKIQCPVSLVLVWRDCSPKQGMFET